MAHELPQGSHAGGRPYSVKLIAPAVGDAGLHGIALVTCESLGIVDAALMFDPRTAVIALSTADGTNVQVPLGPLMSLLAVQLMAQGAGMQPPTARH